MKRFIAIALCFVFAFLLQACTVEKKTNDGEQTRAVTTQAVDENGKILVGEGKTVIDFAVTHLDGSVKKYSVSTDAESLGEALYKLEIIDGTFDKYGIYVKTVDGETLDYNEDGAFWALYVNGESASQGADFIELTDGASYEFKAEAAY